MSGNSYRMPDTMLAVVLRCDRKQVVNSCMQVCSVISERIWYRLRVFVICEDISQANKVGTCCPVPTAWRSSSRHQLPTGLEPATRCLQNSRSSQLSYRSTFRRSGSPEKWVNYLTTNYLQFAYFVNTKVLHTVFRTDNVGFIHNI